MTLYEPHTWDDGYTGVRLKPWAIVVNLVLLCGFCWAAVYAFVAEIVR